MSRRVTPVATLRHHPHRFVRVKPRTVSDTEILRSIVPPPNASTRRKLVVWTSVTVMALASTAVIVYVVQRDPSSTEDVRGPKDAPSKREDAKLESAGPSIESAQVECSSTHKNGGGYTFDSRNLFDQNLATSWQPARPVRAGDPAWIRVTFPHAVELGEIGIANGFQTIDRFGDEFLLNSRIARGRLELDNGRSQPIRFAPDQRGVVEFPLTGTATIKGFTLYIDEVYPGAKWNDLAVSEIEVGR